MTCASCVGTINDAVSELEGVSDVSINLLGKSASAVIVNPHLADTLVELIEDLGYECRLLSVSPISNPSAAKKAQRSRTVSLELQGNQSLPENVTNLLRQLDPSVEVLQPQQGHPKNVVSLTYIPSVPEFTIRTIISSLSDVLPPTISVSIWTPPTSDDIARQVHWREQRNILARLAVAILCAIPTFVIGIIYMSLVPKHNAGRMYFKQHIWAGQVSRGEWALFILATPVMFYSAEMFHRRSLKELWFLWRPGSKASIISRLTRFGSMNLLISLGVSVSYVASVAQLIIAARRHPHPGAMEENMSYFDSVVFLATFLLIGRYIEAFSKHHAASSISLLRKLQTPEALLLSRQGTSSSSESLDDAGKGAHEARKVATNLLEAGDRIRVPAGTSPPVDGTIVSSGFTYFDESSLTGESRDVKKSEGDHVYAGTVNKLRSIDIEVEATGGETMLDKIIDVVRQGQTKRAPIERFADLITSYFVPVITALAISTWIIWLSIGLSGKLGNDTVAGMPGGWPVWSLEFAIAVFIIACPCGIGLAAPTALMVGSGLAAKYGILVRGGGEAFQEASKIEIVVFDKTGTLTEGAEPKVTDYVPSSIFTSSPLDEKYTSPSPPCDESDIPTIVRQLASASSHPLCHALAQHFDTPGSSHLVAQNVEEIPGRGMKGTFVNGTNGAEKRTWTAIMGNEAFLHEYEAFPNAAESEQLARMKREGKSVVLLAISCHHSSTPIPTPTRDDVLEEKPSIFTLVAIFSIADKIRPEAQSVVKRLRAQGVEVWMISGDNEVTAKAVAGQVGIPLENVIAGVLPDGKAEKIQWLQALPISRKESTWRSRRNSTRRLVAMVGDGINDAPALTMADVGIAIGSGSDVALSSAKFILLTSNLRTLLTLIDLSRKVFRRVKFNFLWACIYNILAIPVAAGVIYPAGHVRLDPVWSALAMTLSSTSVVCSSLLLRLYREPRVSDMTHDQQPNESLV
ncbi:E1-E2 ATPase-domain-containing protein [Panaeolus papilionaceus]|nr:E1-E2 ATPase-domain-containing protein [Panaeolus papilionaceus]